MNLASIPKPHDMTTSYHEVKRARKTYFVFYSEQKDFPYKLKDLLYLPEELLAFVGVQCGALKWNKSTNQVRKAQNFYLWTLPHIENSV